MEKTPSPEKYTFKPIRENSKEFLFSFIAFFLIILFVTNFLKLSAESQNFNNLSDMNKVLGNAEIKSKGPRLEPLASRSKLPSISPAQSVEVKKAADDESEVISSPLPSASSMSKPSSSPKLTPKLASVGPKLASSVKPAASVVPSVSPKATTIRKIADINEIPVRVVVEKVGINVEVLNPERKDVFTLDEALKKGAVRHPDSGFLGENANVLIFGHSSHLKVVYNKAYRSFNELGMLAAGDEIKVYSLSTTYLYKVTKVTLMKESEGEVALHSLKPKLTLVTCDNFGAKEDRFIVEAELVNSFSSS